MKLEDDFCEKTNKDIVDNHIMIEFYIKVMYNHYMTVNYVEDIHFMVVFDGDYSWNTLVDVIWVDLHMNCNKGGFVN